MMNDMEIPVLIGSASYTIGPVFANNDYDVIFDDLDDRYSYKPCIDDGIAKWIDLTKSEGTHRGIKLTYRFQSTYKQITGSKSVVNVVRSTDSGDPTAFYLICIK